MRSNLFFTLFFVILGISACSDSMSTADDTLKSIPNDVTMVTAIDADAILEKADFEQVKQMAFYQELIQETKRYNVALAEVLVDPIQSGIDLSKNIYLAHHLDPENPEDVFIGIVASVKDKAVLEKLIQSNDKFKISKHNGFDVALSGSQSVSWNEEQVVMGMTNSYTDPLLKIEKFFNTTEATSIAADGNLAKAISGKHDIASWVSSNAIAKSSTLKNALIMASIDADAIKDNYIHSYVDFEKGNIKGKSDLYLQDALMADINLFFKDKVTTDFSSFVPANAYSVMALALDFEGVQQALVKRPQVSMMAEFGLKEYGLTIDDIANTFGGDVLLYSTPGVGKGATPGSFATTINDTDKLDKFLQLGVDFNFLTKVNDGLYTINNSRMLAGNKSLGDAQLLLLDDIVFISADPTILETVKNGGFSGSARIDKAKIKGLQRNILSGFMDYDEMLKSITGTKDLELQFEDMEFSTNRKEANFDMKFKDKNSNGLKQLLESINVIYLADKKGSI